MNVSTEFNSQQLSAATRLFSPTVFREFAKAGRSPTFARLAKELSPLVAMFYRYPQVRDLYDSVFLILKAKNYRHECIYKSAIANKILLGKHSLNTAVLLDEFRIGHCKADVVVVNGTSNVYEIKTERDSLKRLIRQISEYQKVFANINVIVGENHLNLTLSSTTEEVGVLLLSDRFQISTIRESCERLDQIEPEAIFDSIQLIEAKSILKALDIPIPDLPNTKIYSALKTIFSRLPKDVVHENMVKTLKRTRSQKNLSSFLETIPKSMISTALSIQISIQDQKRLLLALDTPMHTAIGWN